MQQLDEPNEHEKHNEANTTPHKLARETDDPRTSPDPALALEHLLAEAFATFDEPPATTHLVVQTHQTHGGASAQPQLASPVAAIAPLLEMAWRNPVRFAGRLALWRLRKAMPSQPAPTDPSTRANLNRSTAHSDATANDTAVLHSFGGLELWPPSLPPSPLPPPPAPTSLWS